MICNRCGHSGNGDNWTCSRCGNILVMPPRQDDSGGGNYLPAQDYAAWPYAPSGNAFGVPSPASATPSSLSGTAVSSSGFGPLAPSQEECDLSVLNGMLGTQPTLAQGGSQPFFSANRSSPGYGLATNAQSAAVLPRNPMQGYTYSPYGRPSSNPYGGSLNPQAQAASFRGGMMSPANMYADTYRPPAVQDQPPAMGYTMSAMMPRQTPTPRTIPGDTGRIFLSRQEMGTGQPTVAEDKSKAKSAWIPWLVIFLIVLMILIGLLLGYYFGADTPFTLENLWNYYYELVSNLLGSFGT